MADDEKMLEYFIELIGESDHKPFECVGSVGEVNLAVSLAIRQLEEKGEKLPLLFEEYKKRGAYHPEQIDALNDEYCRYFSSENLLPETFKEILIKEMERLL